MKSMAAGNRAGRIGGLVIALVGGMNLTGCATVWMTARYGDLETKAEVTESVFLELRSDLPKTVYVSESSMVEPDVTALDPLLQGLIEAGYAVVEDPDDATYLIQINHLQFATFELEDNQSVNDAVAGAVALASTAGLASSLLGADGLLPGRIGLVAGVVGFVVDAQTKHLAHTLTTEVLITETVLGPGGRPELRYHGTRVVSGASKTGLRTDESVPEIVEVLNGTLTRLMPPVAGMASQGER
jgi:hypothetical protein